MKIFLDSASPEEIDKFSRFLFIKGVTTNPSLLHQSGARIRDIINLCRSLKIKIFVQTLSERSNEIYKEGVDYYNLYPEGLILKIPFSEEGLKSLNLFKHDRIPTAITSIFSFGEILLSLPYEPEYVIPYVNRISRAGANPFNIIGAAKEFIRNEQLLTEILSASFKTVAEVEDAFIAGSDCATIPPNIIRDILDNPLSKIAIQEFNKNAEN